MAVVQEAFARGDQLNTVELAQLAQVDLALRLEAPWYSSHTWLQDGRPEDLLGGLYWLGATRCATPSPSPPCRAALPARVRGARLPVVPAAMHDPPS